MNKLIYLISLSILLSSCTISRLKKQGNKYFEAGLYELATESYLEALNKKDNDIDAKIGFMKAGAQYALQLEGQIDKFYDQNLDDKLVEEYSKLKYLSKNAARHQVPIEISERARGEYQEAKNRFIEDYYAKALEAIKTKSYYSAREYLNKIITINKEYKDCEELLHIATCEPLYISAINSLKKKEYNVAYNTANKLSNIDRNYKDVSMIISEALMHIKDITILENNSRYYREFASELHYNIIKLSISSNNSIHSIIEENEYYNRMNSIYKSLKNTINHNTDDIIPAKTSFSYSVSSIKHYYSPLEKKKLKGFIKTVDRKDSVIYKKIYYYEYYQSKTSTATINYTITDRISNRSIISNSVQESEKDWINYIYYNGKIDQNILPGYWEDISKPFNPKIDEVKDSYYYRNDMRNKALSRRLLATDEWIERKLCEDLGRRLHSICLGR